MSFLEVEGVSKRYGGEAAWVLQDLDFTLKKGQIVVLLGASGCGKTTILKVIAGLEMQDSGHIRIDGELMDGIAPERRPISMVFQKALLFRNMTVAQNVNFSPRVNHTMSKAELTRRTEEMLTLVGMAGMGSKKATAISGGQEQRVSLARALMVDPKLLLLDEPLSALDASLRRSMQQYIRELNRETGVSMVFVTHDQSEAAAVADKLALMHAGQILQFGDPRDFYTRPASKYVASFFGWKNFIPATRLAGGVGTALGDFSLDDLPTDRQAGLLVMRPEAVIDIGNGRLQATVRSVTYEGMSSNYHVICNNIALELSIPNQFLFTPGDTFSFDLNPKMLAFVADDGGLAYS
jgi:ABC-type Fe3+/spermidine/putrescine transport system ATPase subunit